MLPPARAGWAYSEGERDFRITGLHGFGSLAPSSILKSLNPCNPLRLWLSRRVPWHAPPARAGWAYSERRRGFRDYRIARMWRFGYLASSSILKSLNPCNPLRLWLSRRVPWHAPPARAAGLGIQRKEKGISGLQDYTDSDLWLLPQS
jgi:hypothetical protein